MHTTTRRNQFSLCWKDGNENKRMERLFFAFFSQIMLIKNDDTIHQKENLLIYTQNLFSIINVNLLFIFLFVKFCIFYNLSIKFF